MGEQAVLSDALPRESFGKVCSAGCEVALHTLPQGCIPVVPLAFLRQLLALGGGVGFLL